MIALKIIAMELTNQNQAKELRYSDADFEVRAEGEGSHKLRGYALKWGVTYDMGWYTESVDRNALNSADMSDIRILFNHDPNNILGRTKSKTARVSIDDVGLVYEVDLPNSPNGENVRVAVERGDISQSSWGFQFRTDNTGRRIGDKWEMRNGREHRTITDVAVVFDASPVTYPANPDTSVAKRSRDLWEEETKKQTKETNTVEYLARAFALEPKH